MIYKFTVTFKTASGLEWHMGDALPVSTIMYISRTMKDKVFQKLTSGIEEEPRGPIAFVGQQNDFVGIYTIGGESSVEEGTVIDYINENISQEDQKLWLITNTIAINTTNVAEVKVEAQ